MKLTILKVLFPVTILMLIAAACETSTSDSCDTAVCAMPNGECVDDNCQCMPGYEGDNCQTEQRQEFFGNYVVSENCDGNSDSYNMTVAAGMYVYNIVLQNLGNSGADVVGVINGNNLVINSQTFDLGGGNSLHLSGTGSISGNTLSVNCTVYENGGNGGLCSYSCTK
jgi:hypothetical protein